jgi:UV DNA damage endonuclease
MTTRLGYACCNIELREQGIYSTRSPILSTITKIGRDALIDIARQNIRDLFLQLKHNESRGFRFFRITSNLIPHLGNPKLNLQEWNVKLFRPELELVGKFARENGHRLTMHPGQFAQLGSPREDVVTQTIIDLTHHAEILMTMGMTPELGSVLIIHGGGTFGDATETLKRWEINFLKMPQEVRQFVALENDETQYSVEDLLPLCERCSIPLCMDFFHYKVMLNGRGGTDHSIELMKSVLMTWRRRGIRPKCHYSEQKEDARRGAHSDCVSEIPRDILLLAARESMDIMLEVKLKDQCVAQMYKKYFRQWINKVGENERIEWSLD